MIDFSPLQQQAEPDYSNPQADARNLRNSYQQTIQAAFSKVQPFQPQGQQQQTNPLQSMENR